MRIHRISRQLNGIDDTRHAHRIRERMTNVAVGPGRAEVSWHRAIERQTST
jgi:hypothetical protein